MRSQPSLHEQQRRFAEQLQTAAPAWPDGTLAGPHAAQAMQIYRNNSRYNLQSALRNSYPVLGRIVGQDFLAAAAQRYVDQVASHSGDLNAYGDQFAGFLSSWPPVHDLPWLADMARLEWASLQLAGAADAQPQDLSVLTGTVAEQWGQLRFQLHPAHHVMTSSWPILRIWQLNQADYQGDYHVDVDQAQSVLLYRPQQQLVLQELNPAEALFLQALDQQQTLETTLDRLPGDSDFDLLMALQRYISNGLIRSALYKDNLHEHHPVSV